MSYFNTKIFQTKQFLSFINDVCDFNSKQSTINCHWIIVDLIIYRLLHLRLHLWGSVLQDWWAVILSRCGWRWLRGLVSICCVWMDKSLLLQIKMMQATWSKLVPFCIIWCRHYISMHAFDHRQINIQVRCLILKSPVVHNGALSATYILIYVNFIQITTHTINHHWMVAEFIMDCHIACGHLKRHIILNG